MLTRASDGQFDWSVGTGFIHVCYSSLTQPTVDQHSYLIIDEAPLD